MVSRATFAAMAIFAPQKSSSFPQAKPGLARRSDYWGATTLKKARIMKGHAASSGGVLRKGQPIALVKIGGRGMFMATATAGGVSFQPLNRR
jgi:hypothetical protein